MLKRILAIALTLNLVSAAQAASPIALLSEQCLRYEIAPWVDSPPSEPSVQVVNLERDLISLFNLKDSLRYYQQYALNSASQEALLLCQLHLGDQIDKLYHDPNIVSLSQALKNSFRPDEQAIAKRLTQLLQGKMEIADKAALHTSEANITFALRQQALSLVMSNDRCLLKPVKDTALNDPSNSLAPGFSESIASYLIEQSDPHCRQQVWQAYQLRAKDKSERALTHVIAAKQQQAELAGFSDYASFSLASQHIATPQLLKQYLDAMTQPTLAPWELGIALSQADKTPLQPVFTQVMLSHIYQALQPFGIRVESLNDTMIRLWHGQRLLGDLFLNQGEPDQDTSIRVTPIRYSVVGQQFGQVSLSFPGVLDSYRAQTQLIEAFSNALALLLKGGRFYLINTLADPQDTGLVGQYWLSLYLQHQLLPPAPKESREARLATFAEQLSVFRSKLALNLYQTRSHAYPDMAREFELSFTQPWSQANEAIYSFMGIVNQGPRYYQRLWQRSLARLIDQQATIDKSALFELLLINEAQLPFTQQLTLIFGEPVSTSSLIKRIQHDQHAAL
ncbi:M3 family metallopeptidase [Shewanella algidipiscicola]|uniref:M3 family metallopeptidase n=1 Tax=Shewanella algidipiscicola TaxID=614070 RepID=UPI000D78C932|nr:M3 family metallopeptidase [Shewanella algidipiscicola]